MSNLRQVGLGILAALFSTAIVFGSMLLALVEGGTSLALAPRPSDTSVIATPKPGEPTFTPTPTPLPSATPTPTCKDTPSEWVVHEVMAGELLPAIAEFYGIPLQVLRDGNCLSSDSLPPGSFLYVPRARILPTGTPTPTPPTPTATQQKPKKPQGSVSRCSGPPKGWIAYKVRRGDNLFRIALAYGLSDEELAYANCLESSIIHVGQIIYVPSYPSRTPKRTATPRPTTQPPPVTTEPPPVTTEPPPVTTEPPPVTTEPPPATTEPPPAATEPPPATTEPPPPPPATTEPPTEPPSEPPSPEP
jgi:LysM repeat protein